jgi:hypothetical protein
VLTGVPQGSILAPLLFVVYFNDLAKCVSHSSIIVYADDTVIFVSDKNISDIQHKLTCDLDNISKWCADNELILNFSEGKTEAMLFGTHKNLSLQESTLDISCSMHKIQLKTKYKYLGVELDPSLNLGLHFESTYKKGRCENPECRNITEYGGISRNMAEYHGIFRNMAE